MKKSSAFAFARYSAVALIVLALAITLPAQVQTGQFQGTVLDQSGAAVPNATVTATNNATGQSFTAHSSGSGFYTLNQLPAATYNIKATAQGFKAAESKASVLNAGMIEALNFKLTVGEVTQTVEVTSAAPLVQTDDPKLSSTVGAQQIANLPLNGRNVYDLIQMNPGATNVKGVLTENGARTVVNGVREDFNGFTINGVSNKGLSGGNDNQPIADTVQEFQELTLNNSAQYGNSAGAITNLVTKSGTNAWHGDLYEFFRNDKLDANNFFVNQNRCDGGVANGCNLHNNPELRFNQFGGTFGGPLIKDKLFFFAAYQGDRFITSAPPTTQMIESAAYRSAVEAANPNSVAALLYSKFAPQVTPSGGEDINTYIGNEVNGLDLFDANGNGFTSISEYLCPSTLESAGVSASVAPVIAQRLANVFGVTAADQAACGAGALPLQAGTFNRSLPFFQSVTSLFTQQTQVQGNLFNGNEGYLRLDYNASQNDRLFASMNWQKQTDSVGPGLPDSVRGFTNPQKELFPNFQFNYVHTFTPNVLNEFRAGYTANINLINTGLPGVPFVGYDTGDVGFGSYNGYPQFFKENVYTYSDMVTVNHGNHNMKMGVDVRRNIENSEFNVARPSYYFFDPLFFTADAPYNEAAGVDPGFVSGTNLAQLQSNVRHWRNIEFGSYFQDDWKVTRKLTLNLGLRYDLYTRHVEENGLETQFIFGPGNNIADQLFNANAPIGTPGCNTPNEIARAVLAGACGPGGFAAAKALGSGDHNNFGPRLGFAYDVFGNGKTSLRGGVGVSYEGTLYNPLSNSRWNPPFYSFDSISENTLAGVSGLGTGTVVYGPCQTVANTGCNITPTFLGAPAPGNNEGVIGAQATGNINGWFATNPNTANLTGIVPKDIRDPYVYNYYLGIQHEILPQTVMEIDYVGTTGHKLFRAQNINFIPGDRLPVGVCEFSNVDGQVCGLGHPKINPNYGTLRVWENVNNSNYNGLQSSLRHQFSHGLQFAVNYTWSHSIDNGSTWHSGATSSNASGAGEGYSLDLYQPGLDRGNSIYDVRNRVSANYVWELPIFKNSSNGFVKSVLGGWQTNGIWSFQSGAHWEPVCLNGKACDFNLNGVSNDRPDVQANNIDISHDQWANGWGSGFQFDAGAGGSPNGFFTTPCFLGAGVSLNGFNHLPCAGSEGRNTFVGPGYWDADMSLFKNFHITERVNVQFRFETFNTLNHTNFELPGALSSPHNRITNSEFGQAAAAFDPRQLQFGLKLNF